MQDRSWKHLQEKKKPCSLSFSSFFLSSSRSLEHVAWGQISLCLICCLISLERPLSNEAPWCTFANFCLCHRSIIGMWLSMNTQRRVGWPLHDPADSAFVIMEVLSHMIWEWEEGDCLQGAGEWKWIHASPQSCSPQRGSWNKCEILFFFTRS